MVGPTRAPVRSSSSADQNLPPAHLRTHSHVKSQTAAQIRAAAEAQTAAQAEAAQPPEPSAVQASVEADATTPDTSDTGEPAQRIFVAVYVYNARSDRELSFNAGDV